MSPIEKIEQLVQKPISLPFDSDYFEITSYDGNNNPLEIIYKKGGANGQPTATVKMTYDGSSNLLTYTLIK